MTSTEAAFTEAARHYTAGDYGAAEASCRAIIERDPGHVEARHLLGVLLSRQGRVDEAACVLRPAMADQPEHRLIRLNLGNALLAAGQYHEAVAISDSDDPPILNNRGLAHRGLEQWHDAVKAFRKAVTLDPQYAPALFNLATTLARLGELEQALEASQAAWRAAPPDTPVGRLAEVANETGRILMELGRPQDAVIACRRFLMRFPTEASVLWNMSLALLLLGRFPEGWRHYEYRFDVPHHDKRRDDTVVLDPEQLSGRRVLILSEQGRGDMLQFIRYASLLAQRGALVAVQTLPDLVPLLAAMPGLQAVVSTDEVAPEADVRTTVMSLPLAFRTTLATVPATVPYLRVPPYRAAHWFGRLGTGDRPRIGVVWSGSSHSYARSAMPAKALAPLFDLPGIRFHCLQREILASDSVWLDTARPKLFRHDGDLGDFADTAAVIEQMDLVVTIDTAVAHLAGALAKPVWVMLPFNADWRWLLDRQDSPWYPTARLFRQPARGNWPAVVAAVVDAVRAWRSIPPY